MSFLMTMFLIDRSSKKLWAANTQCMTPPLEQGGPWKTRQPFRMIIWSWTTCWANWGTDGTLFVASPSKGRDASPHICCCILSLWTTNLTICSASEDLFIHCWWFVLSCRQNKLEEALLFSGQFTDALQALIDWLYRVEPQLAEDQPVHGDIDLVLNLIDNHKVENNTRHTTVPTVPLCCSA